MSFAEFPAQKSVIQLLQRSIEKGRVAHGYLFMGPDMEQMDGVARSLAKTLNCLNPPRRAENGLALDCCDQCMPCRKISNDLHGDVQWIRPENKIRTIAIEQIRDLLQSVYLTPNEAAYKVAVISAADRLGVQAANAFLKTLEEPPKRSILILTTTEPERILETILSRCLRLQFAAATTIRLNELDREFLTRFAARAAESKSGLLARYHLLGQIVARLTSLKEATEKDLEARSPLEKHDDIDARLKEKWQDELSAAIESEYRRKRSSLFLIIEWWLRDIWLIASGLESEMLALPELLDVTGAVASRLSPQQAAHNLSVIERLQSLLHTNVQEALAIEVSLLKLHL